MNIKIQVREIITYANMIEFRDYMQSIVDAGGNLNYANEVQLLGALNEYVVDLLKHESTELGE